MSFLLRLFFLLALSQNCQLTSDGSHQAFESRPNILWITCEDISPNLGCYGDPYAHTPHLDRLATEGVLYSNAFASAPVCAVARSSIISGMYASSQGSQHMRCAAKRPVGQKMYPELLREAGYYCTNNSKTDYNFEMDHKSIWDQCDGQAHWRNKSNPAQPFFSIFNFTTSHESRVNGKENYENAIRELDPTLLKKPGDVPLPPYYPDTDDTRELWARYYNIITAMDQQVGALLQQLEEDGLRDNTIIIYYSDHGAGVPRHKRWLYDTGIRVPWIVSVPEKYQAWLPHKKGTHTDELVSFIDLPVTVLKIAGIKPPENMEGRAFIGSTVSAPREYIYAGRDRMDERYDMQRCVRGPQYKYIRYYEPYKSFCQYMNTPEKGAIMQAIRQAQSDGTLPEAGKRMVAATKPPEELFDCQKDPFELNNLAGDPAFTHILEKMRSAHSKWSDDTKDTGLIPETILRDWERTSGLAIYDYMRSHAVPVKEIRETALAEIDLPALAENLKHRNAAVRYWAAISLGNQAEHLSSTESLQTALTDETPVVRFAAARALAKLDRVDLSLPILEAGLRHEDEWVRLNAAQVLDELGEAARPSIAALKSVMTDDNKYVVRVANHALNMLLHEQNIVR